MNKLTAEVARMDIGHLKSFQANPHVGLSLKEELYLQALEIALPVLEQQGGWICCSERMPGIGSTILVHMEDPIHSATPYAVATYDKYGFSRSRVTHWQNLVSPQPATTPQIDNDGGQKCWNKHD